jgi:uncharacterized protein
MSESGSSISSVLTEIESCPALARDAPVAASRLQAVLDHIDLIDLDQRIRVLARTVTSTTACSRDAIHLGTALRSRSPLTSFVTYDNRLLDAAQARVCLSTRLPDRNRRRATERPGDAP